MPRKFLKQFAVIGVLKIAYIGHEMLLFLKTRVAFVKIILLKILLFYVASAVNLLKQEKEFKGSLKMKRYLAGMDNNYLVQILGSAS